MDVPYGIYEIPAKVVNCEMGFTAKDKNVVNTTEIETDLYYNINIKDKTLIFNRISNHILGEDIT